MTQRNVNVVHFLCPRRTRGGPVEFLLYPHPRWRSADGRPMLALPTKKYRGRKAGHGESARRDDAITAIFHEDLGLPESPPANRQRLHSVHVRLVSPALSIRTDYAISPEIIRIPVTRHAPVARRLGGDFLTPQVALAQANLSPTARCVLERVGTAVIEWVSAPAERALGSEDEHHWTERLLVGRDGDMEAVAAIFEEMKPRLWGRLCRDTYTRALGDNVADIEDALSEASLKVLEHVHAFNPDRSSGLNWAWIITRNAGIDILRRRGRALPLFAPDIQVDVARLSAASPEPSTLVEQREELRLMRERLARVLRSASALDRTIWRMWSEEDKTYAQIASELEMPLSSVGTRMYRLRQRCRGQGGRGC